MITCFSTLGCPELTLTQALVLAGRHGLKQIEVRALAGGLAIDKALTLEFGKPAHLREALERTGLRLAVFGMSLRLTERPHAGHRSELESILPWSEGVGGAILRVFDGHGGLKPSGLENARENLAWWEQHVRQDNLRSSLAVETHDTLLEVETLDHFLQLFPAVSILWDTHHTWRAGRSPLQAIWRRIAANTVHLHVKDSLTAAGDPAGFHYVEPGTGAFPFGELRNILEMSNFQGLVSLEWEKLWHPTLPVLEVALSAAQERGLIKGVS